MFENPRRGRQATKFTTNVPKILDLKSSSEQIFSENCRWVPLIGIGLFTCEIGRPKVHTLRGLKVKTLKSLKVFTLRSP